MLFSVIVPCYNSKNSIRKCIDSILEQDYTDFEIIVIDDGSTDGTSMILDDIALSHSCIKVYHFPNAGVSYSRRRGITLASGDYLIFVDSDDTINKNLLKNLEFTIKLNSSLDIIRYQANLINDDEHKNHQRYNFDSISKTPILGMESLKQWSIPGKKYAVYWLFAFKRTIFSKVLFSVNLRCYEDVALIPVLVASAERVITIDYVGYNYTCNNSNSLTNVRSLDAERARALDFIKAYEYAIENFSKLSNVSRLDIAFFYADYTKRLHGKFDSLPATLKLELAPLFNL